jgi:thiol-disulfide isomerase/thioredoxin
VSRREVLVLLAVALLAGLLGLALGIARHGPGPLANSPLGRWLTAWSEPALGTPVPAFTVAGLEGPAQTLPRPGQAVLVNYWASWCGPCRDEMPLLSAFAREQGGNGVQVLGIALEEAEPARAFLAAVPVDYPVAVEAPGPADSSARLGNHRGVLPFSVLIGADGRVRARRIGRFADARDLREWAVAAAP